MNLSIVIMQKSKRKVKWESGADWENDTDKACIRFQKI
jgi:hypothetical protein